MTFYAFIVILKVNTNFYGRDLNLAALGVARDPNEHADAGGHPNGPTRPFAWLEMP
jgi:hypothetical protein